MFSAKSPYQVIHLSSFLAYLVVFFYSFCNMWISMLTFILNFMLTMCRMIRSIWYWLIFLTNHVFLVCLLCRSASFLAKIMHLLHINLSFFYFFVLAANFILNKRNEAYMNLLFWLGGSLSDKIILAYGLHRFLFVVNLFWNSVVNYQRNNRYYDSKHCFQEANYNCLPKKEANYYWKCRCKVVVYSYSLVHFIYMLNIVI